MPGALRFNCLNRAGCLLFILAACTSKPEPPPEAPGVQSAHEQAFSSFASPPGALPAVVARSGPGRDALSRYSVPAAESAPIHSWPIPHFPSTDRFPDKAPSGPVSVASHPVSTFSVDIDTASYAVVRRFLISGVLPPRESVRVEEMMNYFRYVYPLPEDRARPFRISKTVMPAPWNPENQVLHIALRGYDIERAQRPRINVVLLIDTSGSMAPSDRLPLLQQSFRLFAQELRDDDRVAIVTYAGEAKTLLEPTIGRDKQKILEAIDQLHAQGATAGAAGLQRAYALAQRHFDKDAVNRVMLATDGDFNVGISDPNELERFIAGKRKTGIYLSIFGVGIGNLNDALMQRLAQAGNGNAAHIDSLLEARKAMSDELLSTMFPIANDVKAQVEFNPALVAEYRLIGYETRMLKREDFKNDKVDAGDIGAGHTVTALYEMIPPTAKKSRVDPLRYQAEHNASMASNPLRRDEIAFIKVRYKLPGESTSRVIEEPVRASEALATIDAAPADQRFAVAVAAFAQRLRGESTLDGYSYGDIAALAKQGRGPDPEGYRAEFIRLVNMAESLGAVAQR